MTEAAFTITVNGKRYNYPPRLPVTYDNIFYLAHPDYRGVAPNGASITYRWRGEGDNTREGIITKDKSIYADSGMIFNCYFTGNA